MNKTTEFLNNVITEATKENASVAKWLENGKWTRQPKAFLRNWLGNDVESERKGRSNIQMACDLVDELRAMKHKNDIKIKVANHYLETGRTPIDFTEPLLGLLNFETAVDNVMTALEATGDELKVSEYIKPKKHWHVAK